MPRDRCLIPECDDPEHYACQLRAKGMQVSPKVGMTQTRNWTPRVQPPPARNGEIIYSERAGGTKMPIIKADGEPLRRKEYEDNRVKYDRLMRQARTPAAAP